jgi:hypothetical protein
MELTLQDQKKPLECSSCNGEKVVILEKKMVIWRKKVLLWRKKWPGYRNRQQGSKAQRVSGPQFRLSLLYNGWTVTV